MVRTPGMEVEKAPDTAENGKESTDKTADDTPTGTDATKRQAVDNSADVDKSSEAAEKESIADQVDTESLTNHKSNGTVNDQEDNSDDAHKVNNEKANNLEISERKTVDLESSETRTNLESSETKADVESSEKTTDLESTKTKSDSESSKTKADLESAEAKSESESSKTKTDLESAEAKSDSEPSKTKTDLESAKAKSDSEPSKTKTDSESSETKTDSESSKTKADLESSETKADLESSETKADLESSETKADLESSETKTDLESQEKKTDAESEKKANLESTERKAESKVSEANTDLKSLRTEITESASSDTKTVDVTDADQKTLPANSDIVKQTVEKVEKPPAMATNNKVLEVVRKEPRAKMSLSPGKGSNAYSYNSHNVGAPVAMVRTARKSLVDALDSANKSPSATKITEFSAGSPKLHANLRSNSIEKDKENKEKSENSDVKSHTLTETSDKDPITITKKLLQSEQPCDKDGSPMKQSPSKTPSKVPKARKSVQPMRADDKNKRKLINSVNLSPVANVTLKLPEIESALGIKAKSLDVTKVVLPRSLLERKAQENEKLREASKMTQASPGRALTGGSPLQPRARMSTFAQQPKKKKGKRHFKGGTYSLGIKPKNKKKGVPKQEDNDTMDDKPKKNKGGRPKKMSYIGGQVAGQPVHSPVAFKPDVRGSAKRSEVGSVPSSGVLSGKVPEAEPQTLVSDNSERVEGSQPKPSGTGVQEQLEVKRAKKRRRFRKKWASGWVPNLKKNKKSQGQKRNKNPVQTAIQTLLQNKQLAQPERKKTVAELLLESSQKRHSEANGPLSPLAKEVSFVVTQQNPLVQFSQLDRKKTVAELLMESSQKRREGTNGPLQPIASEAPVLLNQLQKPVPMPLLEHQTQLAEICPKTLEEVKASLDAKAAQELGLIGNGTRRSLRKRKANVDNDDEGSVVSTATSNGDSELSTGGKRQRLDSQDEDMDFDCSSSPPKLAMVTPIKNVNAERPMPQASPVMPQLISGTGITMPKKSMLDSMVYTHPLHMQGVGMRQQIPLMQTPKGVLAPGEGMDQPVAAATAVPSPMNEMEASQLGNIPTAAKTGGSNAAAPTGAAAPSTVPTKYINTPNGISYPVTPPKTPDSAGFNGMGPDDQEKQLLPSGERDFIPLCCCKINGASLSSIQQGMYCQALDSVDGKVIGCRKKVTNAQLVRPAVKIPFMAVCDVHRKRLQLHQCCPGCGHFCTQGKFYQCKKEGGTGIHHFHKQCQIFKDSKYFCPHCGEESSQFEVPLKLDDLHWSHSDDNRNDRRKSGARMGLPTRRKSDQERPKEAGIAVTTKLPDTDKEISSALLPLGPTRRELENALGLLEGERSKKIRVGPKFVFNPALHGDLEKVLAFLTDGFDPNMKFEEHENQTLLHAAAEGGHLAIVHCLLQAGALPNTQDDTLFTPLIKAAEKNHVDVMDYLLKAGAVIDAKADDGMTALHAAAQKGHMQAVKYLLESDEIDVNIADDGGWTAIIWAAEHQHMSTVKYLLSKGADPNIKDNEENTGLHWAAFSGSVNIAEVFLNAGCDLEGANVHGDRPLHIAARQDHYECVVLFLARGADSEARNNENEAAISCCIDEASQVWMALRVNKQLKGIAAKRLERPERLLHRDISFGKEANTMPVVNGADDENYPQDYLYVTDYVETTPMNVNRVITSLQSCNCKDDCSSMFCVCSRNSVKCWYDKEGRLLKEFNQTEPPLIFECNRACGCWTSCSNRVVQNGITCRLQIFKTSGRGWGARTLLDIPQGTFVCEYIGELISDAEADSREDDSYLFDLDNKDSDTFCIDARKYGNVSRFINHLCEPNLIPVKVFVEHQDLRFPRICFFASRDIKANEELGFDYGEKFWVIKWKHFTCECGSPKCRYSKETIHRTIEEYNKRQEDDPEEVE